MSNFSDLVSDAATAVTDQLMDDASYQLGDAAPVPTRALLRYEDDDSGNLQRTLKHITLPTATVPAPKHGAKLNVLNLDGSVRLRFLVVNEIGRDADFVDVTVRPA